jgi:hypothetical protein
VTTQIRVLDLPVLDQEDLAVPCAVRI